MKLFQMKLMAAILAAVTVCSAFASDMMITLNTKALFEHPQFLKIMESHGGEFADGIDWKEMLGVGTTSEEMSRLKITGFLAINEPVRGVFIIDTPEGQAQSIFDLIVQGWESQGETGKYTVEGRPAAKGVMNGQKAAIMLKSDSQIQLAIGESPLPMNFSQENKLLTLAAQNNHIFALAIIPPKELMENPMIAMNEGFQSLKIVTLALENCQPDAILSLTGEFKNRQAAEQVKLLIDMLLPSFLQGLEVDSRMIANIGSRLEDGKLIIAKTLDSSFMEALNDLVKDKIAEIPQTVTVPATE